VRAGETVRVTLAPPGTTVRLTGRVLAGDEPLPRAALFASTARDETAPSEACSSADADLDGVYALALPGAGSYWLGIDCQKTRGSSGRLPIEGPEAAETHRDLQIPLGTISGRVFASGGAPLAGIEVKSEPERHEDGAHGSSTVRTDGDGQYVLYVPAGHHAI